MIIPEFYPCGHGYFQQEQAGRHDSDRGNNGRRAQWWRIFLREAVSDNELTAMLTILLQRRALDTTTFQAMVQAKTHRFTGTGPAHRPPKQKDQATST